MALRRAKPAEDADPRAGGTASRRNGAGSSGAGAQQVGGRGAGTARAGSARQSGGKDAKKGEKERPRLGQRLREAPAKLVGRSPRLRRWYARRTLKMIAKRRRKGKALPDELLNLERQLRGMPPGQQARALEQALENGAAPPEAVNRAARRAAERPSRQSGRGQGHRPGLPPGTPRPRPPR